MNLPLRIALVLGPILLLVLAWEYAVSGNQFLGFLVGRPSSIMTVLQADVASGALVKDVLVTLGAACTGLIVGAVAGLFLGALVAWNRAADLALSPLVNVLSVIPLFAIGPILVFWFGQGIGSKVFLAFVATAFLAAALAYQHARATPSAMRELVQVLSRSRSIVFTHVALPYAALRLLTNARSLLGVAVSGAIVGEFIGANQGVGHYILVAEGLYNVNRIWAGVVALSVGAVILGLAASAIEGFARRRL